jgi:hypothetical protein
MCVVVCTQLPLLNCNYSSVLRLLQQQSRSCRLVLASPRGAALSLLLLLLQLPAGCPGAVLASWGAV